MYGGYWYEFVSHNFYIVVWYGKVHTSVDWLRSPTLNCLLKEILVAIQCTSSLLYTFEALMILIWGRNTNDKHSAAAASGHTSNTEAVQDSNSGLNKTLPRRYLLDLELQNLHRVEKCLMSASPRSVVWADRRMDYLFGGKERAIICCIRSCNMFLEVEQSVLFTSRRSRTSGNRSRSTNRLPLWWQYQAKAQIQPQPHVFRPGDLKWVL